MPAKRDQGLSGIPPAHASTPAARQLSPQAARALAEAAARRADIDRKAAEHASERGGRRGPEPTRYGDWETKGITSDF